MSFGPSVVLVRPWYCPGCFLLKYCSGPNLFFVRSWFDPDPVLVLVQSWSSSGCSCSSPVLVLISPWSGPVLVLFRSCFGPGLFLFQSWFVLYPGPILVCSCFRSGLFIQDQIKHNFYYHCIFLSSLMLSTPSYIQRVKSLISSKICPELLFCDSKPLSCQQCRQKTGESKVIFTKIIGVNSKPLPD